MQAQICISLDGTVTIVTREGTFEQGRERIEALLGTLRAQGLEVRLERPIEQHRHDAAGQVEAQVEAGR